jgi:hypothetical protein
MFAKGAKVPFKTHTNFSEFSKKNFKETYKSAQKNFKETYKSAQKKF